MTQAVARILDEVQRLSDAERQELRRAIVERVPMSDDLPGDDFAALAAASFRVLAEEEDEGVSVSQLISSALAEKLSALDAERYLNERAERGRKVDIDAILAKIPSVEPEPQDRIPE